MVSNETTSGEVISYLFKSLVSSSKKVTANVAESLVRIMEPGKQLGEAAAFKIFGERCPKNERLFQ